MRSGSPDRLRRFPRRHILKQASASRCYSSSKNAGPYSRTNTPIMQVSVTAGSPEECVEPGPAAPPAAVQPKGLCLTFSSPMVQEELMAAPWLVVLCFFDTLSVIFIVPHDRVWARYLRDYAFTCSMAPCHQPFHLRPIQTCRRAASRGGETRPDRIGACPRFQRCANGRMSPRIREKSCRTRPLGLGHALPVFAFLATYSISRIADGGVENYVGRQLLLRRSPQKSPGASVTFEKNFPGMVSDEEIPTRRLRLWGRTGAPRPDLCINEQSATRRPERVFRAAFAHAALKRVFPEAENIRASAHCQGATIYRIQKR